MSGCVPPVSCVTNSFKGVETEPMTSVTSIPQTKTWLRAVRGFVLVNISLPTIRRRILEPWWHHTFPPSLAFALNRAYPVNLDCGIDTGGVFEVKIIN